jgi:hypothetical protein
MHNSRFYGLRRRSKILDISGTLHRSVYGNCVVMHCRLNVRHIKGDRIYTGGEEKLLKFVLKALLHLGYTYKFEVLKRLRLAHNGELGIITKDW